MAETIYPGVYVEEISSGVRSISGVATSIAAFIGRASRGPVDEPVPINSFAEFERTFGGLSSSSMMSYAVRGFFLNGGSRSLIVRVHNGARAATVSLLTGPRARDGAFCLEAASVGSWGNNLSVTVDHDAKPRSDPTLFNLTVSESDGATEKFLNISSAANNPHFAPQVLERQSLLVRVPKNSHGEWMVPKQRPLVGSAKAVGGSDGRKIRATQIIGGVKDQTGIFALEKAPLFNLLCIPPPNPGGDTAKKVYQVALDYCRKRRAMLIVDPPAAWGYGRETVSAVAANGLRRLGLAGEAARNGALYFPRVLERDAPGKKIGAFVPCGVVAGIIARTDEARGVWKAPAGSDATINGVEGLQVNLSDAQNQRLNVLGINCLRSLAKIGAAVWGARTLGGSETATDEYKYIPVRRLALFIEESVCRGTEWAAFEPNDELLWAQIRQNVGAFMNYLFRQGAFAGRTA
jgi:phage tail sheath protein FI